MSDQTGEAFDDDKLGDEYPPEEPLGVEEYGTTSAEELFDEPLEERLEREEPEVWEGGGRPDDEGLELVAPDEGRGPDTEKDEVARARIDHLGALADDDAASGDTTTRDVATELEGEEPAEEAAVHVIEED